MPQRACLLPVIQLREFVDRGISPTRIPGLDSLVALVSPGNSSVGVLMLDNLATEVSVLVPFGKGVDSVI